MKYQKFFRVLIALQILAIAPAIAQAVINGKVVGPQQEEIAFANVLLLHAADSTMAKGMVSTPGGKFAFEEVPEGRYLVSASMIGYVAAYSSVIEVKNNLSLELPALVLLDDTQVLSEVTIQAQKPLFEQKMDRLIVNVSNSILASGSSVLDVLERSPGISVDRQNNGLSLNGKSGAVVMINGKPFRLSGAAVSQVLAGLNAEQLEKIEIIATPSAQFDADGNAGVINLVLKENMDIGTNGSYSVSAGYGKFEKSGTSFNLNHRSSKFNSYADYTFLNDHLWQDGSINRKVESKGNLLETDIHSDRNAYRFNQFARLGMDYNPGKNTSMGILLSGFSTNWRLKAVNSLFVQEDLQPSLLLDLNNRERNRWRHLMGNFNFSHSFGNGQKLTLDIDRLFYRNSNPSDYDIFYSYLQENREDFEQIFVQKQTPINLWVLKADYSKKINEQSDLELGAKSTSSRLDNNVLIEFAREGIRNVGEDLSGDFKLRENIEAAYANYKLQLGAKTSLQAGLRWEYTQTSLTNEEGDAIVSRRYHSLFPSVFVQRKLSELSNIQYSYSRRITRPSYTDLAPFIIFSDPFTYFSGNTALQPAISDVLQLGYTFRKNYLVSLQYSHDSNHIVTWQIKVDPETNRQATFPDNINNVQFLSVSLNAPFIFNSWWQMENHVQGLHQRIKTDFEGRKIDVSGQYLRFSSSHSFQLPNNFSLELAGLYESPRLVGFATFKSRGSVNLGVKKDLRENRGAFNLSVTDVFWTNRLAFYYDQPELHLNQEFQLLFEPRVVKLSYSKSFGNKNLKSQVKQSTGSEEERRRFNTN